MNSYMFKQLLISATSFDETLFKFWFPMMIFAEKSLNPTEGRVRKCLKELCLILSDSEHFYVKFMYVSHIIHNEFNILPVRSAEGI